MTQPPALGGGLLKADLNYLTVAKSVSQIDLYKDAAAMIKTSVPKEVLHTSRLMDRARCRMARIPKPIPLFSRFRPRSDGVRMSI